MKSRYLLLLPLLLIGCSAKVNNVNYSEPPLEKYTNVSFYLKEEDEDYWWFSSVQETPIQEVILSNIAIQ